MPYEGTNIEELLKQFGPINEKDRQAADISGKICGCPRCDGPIPEPEGQEAESKGTTTRVTSEWMTPEFAEVDGRELYKPLPRTEPDFTQGYMAQRPGTVSGYHYWMDEYGGEMLGGIQKQVWVPGVNQMKCLKNPSHDHPIKDCKCGFHMVRANIFVTGTEWPGRRISFGKVEGWGRMVKGHGREAGYRTEYARIINLYSFPDSPRFGNGINPENINHDPADYAERYGVPIIPFSSTEITEDKT